MLFSMTHDACGPPTGNDNGRAMKKVLEIALGIVTSVGGFLDVGSITTSSEAGASFGFALVWPLALGTICVIFLVEMSGRLAAVSKHTLAAAIRERFGFR